jgi:SOS response regulatory protein OraA/RecX
MAYTYKLESRVFFWILSVLFSSLLFAVLYFFDFFGINSSFPFNISFIILVGLFFLGVFSPKITMKIYSIISRTENELKKIFNSELSDTEKNTEQMISRYKEIFYNLNFGEKQKSIEVIQRTIGFSKESAIKVYSILKEITRTKFLITVAGFLVGIIVYVLFTNLSFFEVIKNTKLFPIAISLILIFMFYFESIIASKLPASFYLNILNINQKQLLENKKDINKKEENLTNLFNVRDDKRKKLKSVVTELTKKGVKKEDIIEILASKGINDYKTKEIIMEAREDWSTTKLKTNFDDVAKDIKIITDFHNEIKNIEQELLNLKKNIVEIKIVQETIEKINSDDWDYYKHMQFSDVLKSNAFEKVQNEDIINKIHLRREVKSDYGQIINELYNTFLPSVNTLSKDKISSILISKGYSYEIVTDLLDKFKQNKVVFKTNNNRFQDKLISKINNLYESFKD